MYMLYIENWLLTPTIFAIIKIKELIYTAYNTSIRSISMVDTIAHIDNSLVEHKSCKLLSIWMLNHLLSHTCLEGFEFPRVLVAKIFFKDLKMYLLD